MYERRTHEPHNVVVTGASAGVGRATAIAFAKRGCNVALIARGRAGLEGAARDVLAAGGRPLVIQTDVSDADAVFAAAEQIVRAFGPIDVWVNNAMATVFGPSERIPPAEFKRVMEVTFHGYVHGTLAALRHMRQRNRGVIIQVGSALAFRAIPLQGAYCAAKFAIRGFTDSLRSELIHDNSRVQLVAVHLPAVNTPQFDWTRSHVGRSHRPLGTVFTPEAIARAIVAAARSPRREYWLGWSTIQPILGEMFVPEWLDRRMAQDAYLQITKRPAPREDILFFPGAARPRAARALRGAGRRQRRRLRSRRAARRRLHARRRPGDRRRRCGRSRTARPIRPARARSRASRRP